MSKNLDAFFSKNKKQTKKQPTQDDKQSQQQSSNQQSDQLEQKPKDTKLQAQDDYERSDDEETELKLDSNIAVVDKAAVDAAKRKKQQEEEQESGASGWRALEKQGVDQQKATQSQQPKSLGGQPSAGKSGDIKFSAKGPPKFSKQKKATAMKLDEEFPELGAPEVTKPASKEQPVEQQLSKKDNANIDFMRGSASSKPAPVEEAKKEATKPMFTRSKKPVVVGGDDVKDIQSSKQNYDFSVFQTSNFSEKQPRKERAEGDEESKDQKPRQRRDFPQGGFNNEKQAAADDFADFQTVTDKRQRRPKEGSAF